MQCGEAFSPHSTAHLWLCGIKRTPGTALQLEHSRVVFSHFEQVRRFCYSRRRVFSWHEKDVMSKGFPLCARLRNLRVLNSTSHASEVSMMLLSLCPSWRFLRGFEIGCKVRPVADVTKWIFPGVLLLTCIAVFMCRPSLSSQISSIWRCPSRHDRGLGHSAHEGDCASPSAPHDGHGPWRGPPPSAW